MAEQLLRVLFICTGNSARSQMAEAILHHLSKGRIEVFSAGSHPSDRIHPLALETVRRLFGNEMKGQRPKPFEEFLGQPFDFVISVCDRAAEACPVFPGDPERIRWSVEDPAEIDGTDEQRRRAFEQAATSLMARIRIWMSLPAISSRIGVATVGHAV